MAKRITVRLTGKCRGSVFLPVVNIEMLHKRNSSVMVDEDVFYDPRTQALISRGLIEPVGNKGERLKVEDVQEDNKEKADTHLASWDMEKQTLVDKDQSRKTTLERINSLSSDVVQSGKIDFDKEDKKDFDDSKAYYIYVDGTSGKEISREVKKPGRPPKSAIKDGKNWIIKKSEKSAIKPVGNVKAEPKADDLIIYDNSNNGDIGFVDEMQERERLQKRKDMTGQDLGENR